MSEPQTYSGGCQCGQVRYQAKVDLSQPVLACNCSMCGRAGSLLSFVAEDQFTLLAGQDAVTDYLFNKHRIHHLFCKTCGIKSFARGAGKDGPMVAINVRCLDGVDPEKLTVKHVDGKSA
jgi:hypothetical protein